MCWIRVCLFMKRVVFLIICLVVVFVVSGIVFYFSNNKENSDELVIYGNVDVRQVDIGFRVAGQVETLCYEEGDVVAKGTLLAKLDKTPYNSEVAQAAANKDAVEAALVNAEKLLKRRKALIGSGAVSQENLDDVQSQRDQLRANLDQAESALAVALNNLEYTETFAPTEGVILTRIREPGTVVNPADPVYTLSVSSPVWIRAYVSEANLGDVCYGMKAEIVTDAKGAPKYTGMVGFISPVSEFTPKTVETTELRTDLVYRLRIYVDNPDGVLKQGMPVTVKLKRGCGE